MVTRIQALGYRCLRFVDRRMGGFHVLVGPNASGKSTFLDVIAFLGQMVSEGLPSAIEERTRNFQDLTWRRQGNGFELAIEALIPPELRARLKNPSLDTVRYEVGVRWGGGTQEIGFSMERVSFKSAVEETEPQRDLFPSPESPPRTILGKKPPGAKLVIHKVPGRNDNFYAETGRSYNPSFKLGPGKSALGNLPADESAFPVANWFRRFLAEGVQPVFLDSWLLRQASRPGQGRRFKPDGSNLPWVVDHLRNHDASRFQEWVGHLRTALPDLEDVRVVQREDDKHAYLVLCYRDALQVPSWMASDGTLRLLALTIPAYLPELRGVYLVEEPENGIHPKAVETVFQSLSSVYEAQVLLASHSPVVLSQVKPAQVLCFARDGSGATDIVPGDKHPALREWQGIPHFNVLFAAGVLS